MDQEKKQKSNKRSMAGTITKETKREGQGKAKRRIACNNQKREKISPFHDRNLSHSWPF
jgi:hypothetical protein